MRRRTLVSAVGLGAAGSGWYLWSRETPPRSAPAIRATTGTTVRPGATGEITITAEHVAQLHVTLPDPPSPSERVYESFYEWLQTDGNVFDPSPTISQQSGPPYYQWKPPAKTLSATIPVSVPSFVPPGTYTFAVTIWNQTNVYDGGVTAPIDITVTSTTDANTAQ